MRVAVVVVLVAAVLVPQGVLTYSMSFGGCAKVTDIKNFKQEEFTGVWYVIETFSTSGKCLTLTFEQKGKTDFKVTEGREYVAAQVVGINHAFQTKGVYQAQSAAHPAKFNARWSNRLAVEALRSATGVGQGSWTDALSTHVQLLSGWFHRSPFTSWMDWGERRGDLRRPEDQDYYPAGNQPSPSSTHNAHNFHSTADILGGAEATVVDTDYWQYAVLVECQPVMYFMKRTSAAILSRKRNLDLRVLNELKRDLVDTYGIDLGDLEVVDHNRCKSTPKEIQKEEDTKEDDKKPIRKFHLPASDVAAPPTPPPTQFPPSTPKPTPKPAPKPAPKPPRTTHIQAWCHDLGLC